MRFLRQCSKILPTLALGTFLIAGVAHAQQAEERGHAVVLDGGRGSTVTLDVPTVCLDYRKAAPDSRERLQVGSSRAEEEVQRVLSVARLWKLSPDHRQRVLSQHPMYAELLKRAKLYREAMICCEEARTLLAEWKEVRPRWQRVQDIASWVLSDEMLRTAAQRAVWAITAGLAHHDLVQDALKKTRISKQEANAELSLNFEAPYTQLLLDAATVANRWINEPVPSPSLSAILRELFYPSDQRLQTAEEKMLRLYQEAKERFDVPFRRGVEAIWDGRFETAAEELEQARQHLPQHVETLHLLGNAYFHLGNYQKAVDSWEAVIGFDGRHADAYFNLALAYERLGRREEAIRAASRFTVLRPADREAKALRARLTR